MHAFQIESLKPAISSTKSCVLSTCAVYKGCDNIWYLTCYHRFHHWQFLVCHMLIDLHAVWNTVKIFLIFWYCVTRTSEWERLQDTSVMLEVKTQDIQTKHSDHLEMPLWKKSKFYILLVIAHNGRVHKVIFALEWNIGIEIIIYFTVKRQLGRKG